MLYVNEQRSRNRSGPIDIAKHVRRALALNLLWLLVLCAIPMNSTASLSFFTAVALTFLSVAITPTTLAQSSDTVSVFIETDEPGVAEYVYRQRQSRQVEVNRQQQINYARGLDDVHTRLSRRLAPLVTKEHSRLRVALSGFRATVPRKNLDALRALPGVRAVTPLRHHELENIDSVPWVQAPQLWESYGDGQGMTIAVIDSGIDYLHANFGGDGNPQTYADNDFAVIEPGSFPTAKVIGGWDFAGPTYNSRVDDEPTPDADPIDGHGHGSHVAGTAAGLGVEGRIGPGVAKGASLLAVKVFSDLGGSTDLTVDGIELALDPNQDGSIDDHVDVINMSLGARFGLPTDPSAVASSHAVRAGVIVVASAGNNGDIPYVTGSPGVSPDVITVAASISGGRRQIALGTSLDDYPLMPALEGAGPVKLTPDVLSSGIAVAAGIEDGVPGTACEPLDNPEELKGRAVLVSRGECLFPIKYQHVQDAGGIAVIVVNSSDSVNGLFVMGGLYPDTILIPGLMITSTDGQRLLDALAGNTPPTVTFSTSFTVPTPTDQDDVIAGFSSQGPGASGAGFKPDLAAPGRFTVSTQAGTGVEGVQRRGTSMAAPHVAGMAALLKQQFPNDAPSAIKARLKNAASPSLSDGPGGDAPEPLSRQGNGVMRGAVASALNSRIEPASASFGYLNLKTAKSAARELTLYNDVNERREFIGRQEIVSNQFGITVECPESVVVGPLQTSTVRISLHANADLLASDNGRMSRNESTGWCVFTDGRDELRVGYVAGSDGASDVKLNAAAQELANGGTHRALAHSFVLIAEAEAGRPGEIAAFGWRHAELFTQPVFELGVALKNPWDNPSNYQYFLRIDTDNDTVAERTLFAVDWSRLGFDPGVIITGLDYIEDLADVGSEDSISSWMAEDIDFNDRVVVLPWFNTSSGINALFKPHERQLNVTLIVIDRSGNQSSLSGTINLDNPEADAQTTTILSTGSVATVEPGLNGQLWLVPTNLSKEQVLVAPGASTRTPQRKAAPVKRCAAPGKHWQGPSPQC